MFLEIIGDYRTVKGHIAGASQRSAAIWTSCSITYQENPHQHSTIDTCSTPASIINTFAASYLNTQGLNNSCLKWPASTLVDLIFQSRALRSFSLNQLRNLSL